jgi:N6-L-threonylcarbamoyladenine synthase
MGAKANWNIHIPKMEYCTDNAAMIAITGYYKFLKKEFASVDTTPLARYTF